MRGFNVSSRQHTRIDGQCKQRDGNSKKEPKRNISNKKPTVTEMDNAFYGLIKDWA